MNVISCNFPLISHSSSFCVNLSTIIMKVESVTTVVGFFNAFFGLLFCGKVAPGTGSLCRICLTTKILR